MLLFHGDADRNVPYDAVLYDGNGFFGSKHIADMLTEPAHPALVLLGRQHQSRHGDPPMYDNRYEIDAFLEKLVLKREPLVIDTYVTPVEAPNCEGLYALRLYRRQLRQIAAVRSVLYDRPPVEDGFFMKSAPFFSVSNR